MKSIQDLREKRAAKAKEARNLLDSTITNWTAETKTAVDGIYADIELLDEQIVRFEKALKIEDTLDTRAVLDSQQRNISVDEARQKLEQDRRAFNSFLRGGYGKLSDDDAARLEGTNTSGHKFKVTNTTPSEGGTAGVLVPTTVMPYALAALKAFGGMREAATVIATSSGNPLSWGTYDDTASEGEIVGENVGATDDDDIPFGSVTIGAYKFSSKVVPISIELLQDSAVPVDQLVQDALLMRIARGQNHYFTTGSGSSQPHGIDHRATVGKTGASGQTTSVIYADLVDLEHSVDPAYRLRPSTRWMFADSTLKILKKLVDGSGRPLWLPGTGSGLDSKKDPDTLLGYAYTINQNVAAMATSAKSIFFGDFSKYLIRDVMAIQLFRFTDSVYVKKGQIGFMAWARADGDMIDATYTAIKYYANSAS